MKFTIIFFSVFHTLVWAQSINLGGVLPVWNQTSKINEKLNYNLYISTIYDTFDTTVDGVQYPSSDLQIYIQHSLIYTLNPHWNFSGSYTFIRGNPFLANYVNEHRIWEQATYSHTINYGRMVHRLRFEQRFIQNRITNKYPLSTRLRYQLGYSMPLQGKTLDEKEFYFNTYNEFYFSFTGLKNATYSDNWSYIGSGYNFGEMGRLELGYLLQTTVRNTQKDLRFLHLLQIMLGPMVILRSLVSF